MKKITIEIIDSTADEPVSPDQASSKTGADSTTEGGKKNNKREIDPRKQLVIDFVKGTADKTIELAERGASLWYNMEDDYIGQTNVSNAMVAIKSTENIISSAVSIGKVGFVIGGAAGAAVGAAAGLIGGGISLFINAHKTVINEYQQLDQIAYSQYFSGVRYGLINGSRGTEN